MCCPCPGSAIACVCGRPSNTARRPALAERLCMCVCLCLRAAPPPPPALDNKKIAFLVRRSIMAVSGAASHPFPCRSWAPGPGARRRRSISRNKPIQSRWAHAAGGQHTRPSHRIVAQQRRMAHRRRSPHFRGVSREEAGFFARLLL